MVKSFAPRVGYLGLPPLVLSRLQINTRKSFDPYTKAKQFAFSEELKKSKATISGDLRFLRAPRVGIEPTTNRLTVDCSTAELPRNTDMFPGEIEHITVTWKTSTVYQKTTQNAKENPPLKRRVFLGILEISDLQLYEHDVQAFVQAYER